MTVAITGATGFVGQTLLDEAARRGIEVQALTRSKQKPRDGVRWVSGDLADEAALFDLVDGCEAVIHVAGVVNAPDAAGFEEGNVRGTVRLIDAARKAGVQRFVFVSSLSARAPELSNYGASKARAERQVRASGLDWTIVRPPGIFGPRDREVLEMFKAAKWGVVPMPPPGRASWIHVDDLARLLLALVPGGEDVSHRIFEPDDGRRNGWSHREWGRAIGWAVGRRPWVPHLSQGLLEKAAKADRMLRGGKAKLTPDRVGYMVHPDWTVDPGKAVPEARWTPQVDPRKGLKDTARWYREHKWL